MEDDPQRRKPDITRAKVILGWEPQVTLISSNQSYSIVQQHSETRRVNPNQQQRTCYLNCSSRTSEATIERFLSSDAVE